MNAPEIMAKRLTADGKTVLFWNDGAITSGMHDYVAYPPRRADRFDEALRAAWLVAGEVSLYDWAELPTLIKAAREAVRKAPHNALVSMRLRATRALERAGAR